MLIKPLLILPIKNLINTKLPCFRIDAKMRHKTDCLKCQHMDYKKHHARYVRTQWGGRKLEPTIEVYYCKLHYKNINMPIRYCKDYLSINQTSLKEGLNRMVKLDMIPTEGARVELKDLPQIIDLKAISERIVEPSEGKSGGVVIEFETRDGKTFPQKYTKVSGRELISALKELKLSDTMDLQDKWYTYRLSIMRIGMPRMIPKKLAKEQGKNEKS